MNIPEEFHYTQDHEWLDAEGKVGITDYAQAQLGDVVFVELPELGYQMQRGEPFGVVESVKSVSDLYSPVDGEVEAVNRELETRPELINQDPHGAGWIIRLKVTGSQGHLWDASTYRQHLPED